MPEAPLVETKALRRLRIDAPKKAEERMIIGAQVGLERKLKRKLGFNRCS
jgi:hypothetical protein